MTDPVIKHEIHHYAMQLTITTATLRELEVGMSKKHLNLELMDLVPVKAALLDVSWGNIFISQNDFERESDSYKEHAASMFEFLNSVDVLNCGLGCSTIVCNSVDFNVLSFYFVLFSIFARFAPLSKDRSSRENPYPEWFSSVFIQVLKDKRKALKTKRRNPTPENIARYKQILGTFKVLHREAYQVYVTGIQNGIKENPKSFWKFVNSRRKNIGIPEVMKYGNRSANNGQDTAELFAEYFKSVYHNDHSNEINSPVGAVADSLELSREEVRQGLSDLDAGKSAGPDKFPAKFLKEFMEELIEPLSILFNSSLSSGYFPPLWKISHITPIHKKGSRSDAENYRGVAIQSAMPKLFERLVYSHLYERINERVSTTQHGFLKGKSVVTNLCEFSSMVTDYISKGYQVDCVYTDMSKAFDVVGIDSIMRAVADFGINGVLFEWIRTYLQSRIQYVKVLNNTSSSFGVHSGVPQGSHLGPLLFVMVMNKLPSFMTKAIVLIYALPFYA